MQKIYILIFLFTFSAFFTNIFAQEKEKKISKKDSLEILTFQKQIDTLKKQKKYNEAIEMHNKLSVFLKNKKYWGKYFGNELEISEIFGTYLGKNEDEKKILDKICAEMQEKKLTKNITYAKGLGNIGRYYIVKNDIDSANIFIYKSKYFLEKYYPKNNALLIIYNNLLNSHFDTNIDSLNFYFNKIDVLLYKIYEGKSKNNTDFGRYYSNRGVVEMNIFRNYNDAKGYLKKAYDVYNNLVRSEKNLNPRIITNYFIASTNLGQVLGYLEEYKEAKIYFKNSENILDNNSKIIELPRKMSFYGNFGSFYVKYSGNTKDIQQKKVYLDSALYLYNQQAILCEQNPRFYDKLGGIVYPDMGVIYRKQNDHKNEFLCYTKAEEKLQIFHKNNLKNYDFGFLYGVIAESYHKTEQHQNALKMYQKAIFCIVNNFNDTLNLYKNPNIKGIKTINDNFFLNMIEGKAMVLSNMAIKSKDKIDWQYAFDTYKIAIDFADIIVSKKKGKDVLAFYQIQENSYKNILRIANELNDKKLYFEYLEQYKAGILRAEVSQNQEIKGINPNLLQQEINIKNDITQIEGQIAQTPADKNLQDKYFQRNLKLDSLVSVFEKMNPEYHSLKYTGEVITLEKTKQKLTENQAVVQYIVADKALYIMVITKNITEIKKVFIEKDSLLDKINVYRDAFKKNSKVEELVYLSMDLYQILIKDILPLIKDKNHWFIVPDNALFEINFEALFEKLPNTTKYDKNKKIRLADFPWHEVDYILHKHIITMALSATLTFDEKFFKKQETINIDDILLVAPVYTNKEKGSLILAKNLDTMKEMRKQEKGDRAGISEDGKYIIELEHSKTEVENIANLFQQKGKKSTILLEENATELNYREKAKNAKIVHLSTHSYFHNRDYRLSAITFWQPDSVVYNKKPNLSDDGMLFGTEVYGMNLSNTNLVVLSSCEGGLGKIIGGEGPMAITRGFMYAGVPNLLYSIYKVGDKHTAELMPYFYKYVLEGKKYSESLNFAKKDFIKAKKGSASLNTWAGFVIMER